MPLNRDEYEHIKEREERLLYKVSVLEEEKKSLQGRLGEISQLTTLLQKQLRVYRHHLGQLVKEYEEMRDH